MEVFHKHIENPKFKLALQHRWLRSDRVVVQIKKQVEVVFTNGDMDEHSTYDPLKKSDMTSMELYSALQRFLDIVSEVCGTESSGVRLRIVERGSNYVLEKHAKGTYTTNCGNMVEAHDCDIWTVVKSNDLMDRRILAAINTINQKSEA